MRVQIMIKSALRESEFIKDNIFMLLYITL